MPVAGGLYPDGNPTEKVIGHGRTDEAPARLRIKAMARFTLAWFVT